MPAAALLLRMSSQLLHCLFGALAVFCLYYAAWVPSNHMLAMLLINTAKCGGVAIGIAFFQQKHLSNV